MRVANLLILAVTATFLAGCGINNVPTYQQAMKARWGDVEIGRAHV